VSALRAPRAGPWWRCRSALKALSSSVLVYSEMYTL
jgi:hypothetical protein